MKFDESLSIQVLFTIYNSLFLALPFTVLNATTTLDFFPFFVFSPPLFLAPGKYWFSPMVTYAGASGTSWAVYQRDLSLAGVIGNGDVLRRKDLIGNIV